MSQHSRSAPYSASSSQDRIVSDDADTLVLVNSADEPLGTIDKAAAHDGVGRLHRAFSLFVFNTAGELLLQQRHRSKRLWPGYWSNSCCSHPRAHEPMDDAVTRRAQEELGIQAETRFLYKFEYAARFGDAGGEHELCWVFLGRSDDHPRVNTTEVQAWRWIAPGALDAELAQSPQRFTPWLQLEWDRLRGEFKPHLHDWLAR
jgi:isopentenyl-diphosphate Delta-isomerase